MFAIVSLNVLNDPRIAPDSPRHFSARWPRIRQVLDTADVAALQEVHQSFLPVIAEYAEGRDMRVASALYHKIRATHLVTLVPKDRYVGHDVSYYGASYTATLTVHLGGGIRVTNVHLPLDARDAGERRATTREVVARSAGPGAIIVGDWNTLPGLGDREQLQAAEDAEMSLVEWTISGDVPTTVYGFPHEEPRFQGFCSPAVLDRAAVWPDVAVESAVCLQEFGPDGFPVSDHFPCRLVVSR